ncbi:hypothetical protein GGS21DRAFT_343568 [Xylaria nigripes]|nr:hypothetical protein GGS21DRAFT_343568 [Xylaria nigripes]
MAAIANIDPNALRGGPEEMNIQDLIQAYMNLVQDRRAERTPAPPETTVEFQRLQRSFATLSGYLARDNGDHPQHNFALRLEVQRQREFVQVLLEQAHSASERLATVENDIVQNFEYGDRLVLVFRKLEGMSPLQRLLYYLKTGKRARLARQTYNDQIRRTVSYISDQYRRRQGLIDVLSVSIPQSLHDIRVRLEQLEGTITPVAQVQADEGHAQDEQAQDEQAQEESAQEESAKDEPAKDEQAQEEPPKDEPAESRS